LNTEDLYVEVAWTPTNYMTTQKLNCGELIYDMYYSSSTKFTKKHHKLETQTNWCKCLPTGALLSGFLTYWSYTTASV